MEVIEDFRLTFKGYVLTLNSVAEFIEILNIKPCLSGDDQDLPLQDIIIEDDMAIDSQVTRVESGSASCCLISIVTPAIANFICYFFDFKSMAPTGALYVVRQNYWSQAQHNTNKKTEMKLILHL